MSKLRAFLTEWGVALLVGLMVWSFLALVLLSVRACSAQEPKPWSTTHVVLAATSTALIVTDLGQTLTAQRLGWVTADGCCYQHEGNFLLGSYPSEARILVTGGVVLVGNLYVANRLRGRDRTLWLGLVTLLEGFVVYSNYRSGARIYLKGAL